MMKVRYVGPFVDGVWLPDWSERDVLPGETIDVPQDMGENLVTQSDWEAVKESKKPTD